MRLVSSGKLGKAIVLTAILMMSTSTPAFAESRNQSVSSQLLSSAETAFKSAERNGGIAWSVDSLVPTGPTSGGLPSSCDFRGDLPDTIEGDRADWSQAATLAAESVAYRAGYDVDFSSESLRDGAGETIQSQLSSQLGEGWEGDAPESWPVGMWAFSSGIGPMTESSSTRFASEMLLYDWSWVTSSQLQPSFSIESVKTAFLKGGSATLQTKAAISSLSGEELSAGQYFIAGWEDATTSSSNDGAWIVWDPSTKKWEKVPFGSKNIVGYGIVNLKTDGMDDYEIVDQYDMAPPFSYVTASSSESIKSASVYEASVNQTITAASIVTMQANSHVRVELWALGQDFSGPEDGALIATSEQDCQFAGNHLLEFDVEGVIPQGRSYSLVVTETTNNGEFHVSVPACLTSSGKLKLKNNKIDSNGQSVVVVNEGESWIMENGQWKDLTSVLDGTKLTGAWYLQLDNAPIKGWSSETEVAASDVHDGDWYDEVVEQALAQGYMRGYDDGSFGPSRQITRAEAAAVLANMGRLYSEEELEGVFPDVADADWFQGVVGIVSKEGIMNGYTNGDFGPNDLLTREQFACALFNYAKLKFGVENASDVEGVLNTMPDGSDVSAWAREAVAWAVEQGIMGNGGLLNPKEGITRAEAAAMALNLQPSAL